MRIGKKSLVGLVALVAAAALFTACAKKEAPKAAPAAPAPAEKKIKAGFVYVGPVGDLGFTNAHDVARQQLVKEMPWLEDEDH